MTNNLGYKIDMPCINNDGTVEVMDANPFSSHPFVWRYKLYDSYEKNMKSLLSLLFSIYPEKYEFTPRLAAYIANRRKLYETAQQYIPLIQEIKNSNFPLNYKTKLLNSVDEALNALYPYSE